MRGENKPEQVLKSYFFQQCKPCGVKLHVHANKCWICGQQVENKVYRSNDPKDAIYSTNMNSVKKCIRCANVLYLKKICEPISCFGTGRGKCDECKELENTRFDCCQEEQQKGAGQTKSLSEEFKKLTQNANPGPMAELLAGVIERYDDIPF
jgi:hypothetical protein